MNDPCCQVFIEDNKTKHCHHRPSKLQKKKNNNNQPTNKVCNHYSNIERPTISRLKFAASDYPRTRQQARTPTPKKAKRVRVSHKNPRLPDSQLVDDPNIHVEASGKQRTCHMCAFLFIKVREQDATKKFVHSGQDRHSTFSKTP